jgi:hypothetical protein
VVYRPVFKIHLKTVVIFLEKAGPPAEGAHDRLHTFLRLPSGNTPATWGVIILKEPPAERFKRKFLNVFINLLYHRGPHFAKCFLAGALSG